MGAEEGEGGAEEGVGAVEDGVAPAWVGAGFAGVPPDAGCWPDLDVGCGLLLAPGDGAGDSGDAEGRPGDSAV